MCEIGEVFTGFCDGYFGRNSWGEKRVEAFGADWIVCRDEAGQVVIAKFDSRKEKDDAVRTWRTE
jgi:hypothetical protein